jgi:hypothetical protein
VLRSEKKGCAARYVTSNRDLSTLYDLNYIGKELLVIKPQRSTRGPHLIILLLSEPHLLEGAADAEHGPADPSCVVALYGQPRH